MKEPMILHLTLKKKWFDMIASGEKKEEYREQKAYWQQRLVRPDGWHNQICKQFDVIRFRNGYATDAPTMDVECLGIELKDDGREEWGFQNRCFVISLGKILTA